MKSKNLLIVVLVMASLLAVPVFAACTGVCDTSNQYSCSKSITTLTKGTSSTLTVTITNQQSEAATSLTAALQGSWFSASSSSTTIASIQANGGTGTADFSITPTSTGGQDVCVSLGSTCTADCGTITVSSAAELGVTSITAPASVGTSSTFTVSATIRNAGTETAGSSTGVTATLTSSQCTVSSETKTIGTITGSGTSSISWSVTAPSSATTCTFSLSASGTPGGTATDTKSVTVSGTTTTAASSSSGSSSGGGGSSSNDTANKTIARAVTINDTKVTIDKNSNIITIPSIPKNTAALVNIPNPAAGVTKIAFAVKNDVSNVSMTITKLDKTPAAPALPGKVFSYIQIDKSVADTDISSATIEFQVDKNWLNANKIDKSTVSLNRLSGTWARLVTKQTGETATHAIYQAESPGLSVFAITGAELPTTVTTAAPINLPQVVKDYGIWIVVFAIIAAVLGYLYYHGRHHVRRATKFAYDFKK